MPALETVLAVVTVALPFPPVTALMPKAPPLVTVPFGVMSTLPEPLWPRMPVPVPADTAPAPLTVTLPVPLEIARTPSVAPVRRPVPSRLMSPLVVEASIARPVVPVTFAEPIPVEVIEPPVAVAVMPLVEPMTLAPRKMLVAPLAAEVTMPLPAPPVTSAAVVTLIVPAPVVEAEMPLPPVPVTVDVGVTMTLPPAD